MTNRSGGTRLRLLIGASAAVLVAAACGGSVTPTASRARATHRRGRRARPATPPRRAPGHRRDRPVQHGLRARRRRRRRHRAIIGDWQEATQFNPYYLTQVTEANVAVGDVGRPSSP